MTIEVLQTVVVHDIRADDFERALNMCLESLAKRDKIVKDIKFTTEIDDGAGWYNALVIFIQRMEIQV